jgi:hypothetical protein
VRILLTTKARRNEGGWPARIKGTRHLVPYKQITPIGHAKSPANRVESCLIQPDPNKNDESFSESILQKNVKEQKKSSISQSLRT